MPTTKFNKASTDHDDPEENNTDGILFWVNKSGFPIIPYVWDRMFDHAAKVHPQGDSAINKVRFTTNPPTVTIPKPPLAGSSKINPVDRIAMIQQYMRDLQYNHTGTQFFDIKKYRPVASLNETAKDMIRESLPIKCLEAVILGVYLTNGAPGLERLPLSFRSVFGSNVHRHVVLVVSWNGLYGALGMSRREDLMYKPLTFPSLADLVIDFIESYNQYWHKVNKLKIGFPVSHNPYSNEPIHWKGLTTDPTQCTRTELRAAVDKHARDIKAWLKQYRLSSDYIPHQLQTTMPCQSHGSTSTKSFSSVADGNSTPLSRSMSSMSLTSKLPKHSKKFEMKI